MTPSRLEYSLEPLDLIKSPEQIAYYSCFPLPEKRTYAYECQSYAALKCYHPQETPFTFNPTPNLRAFSEMCRPFDSLPPQEFDPVISSCKDAGRTVELRAADIITRKGVLLRLAMGEKGVYQVSFKEGQLYIRRGEAYKRQTESHHYYGYYFEQEWTTQDAKADPRATFYTVMNWTIGGLKIIMAGEVDCSADGTPNPENYIELKTFKSARRNKPLTRFYLQSYLTGVQKMVIGYRDEDERVCSVEEKTIKQIPQDAQAHKPQFGTIRLERAHAILSALLKYFRSLGQSVSEEDNFELRIDKEGAAEVVHLAEPSALGDARKDKQKRKQQKRKKRRMENAEQNRTAPEGLGAPVTVSASSNPQHHSNPQDRTA